MKKVNERKMIIVDTEAEYDDDNGFEYSIEDPIVASRAFRSFVQEQESRKKKEKMDSQTCETMYNDLSDYNKYIINNILQEIVGDIVNEQHFGDYFSTLFEQMIDPETEKPLIMQYMAQLIASKYECCYDELYDEKVDDSIIKAILQSFKKKKKADKRSSEIEKLVCDIFSIDSDALEKGKGIKYSLNESNIDEILLEQKKDRTEFFSKVWEQYIPCNKCEEVCDQRKWYAKYQYYNMKGLGETIAEMLGVNSSEIVQETKIEIRYPIKEFPLMEYFTKLSSDKQRIISMLIRELYIKQYLWDTYTKEHENV